MTNVFGVKGNVLSKNDYLKNIFRNSNYWIGEWKLIFEKYLLRFQQCQQLDNASHCIENLIKLFLKIDNSIYTPSFGY